MAENEVVKAEAEGGEEEGGKMFKCELCGEKQYAYKHKLKLCRQSET